MDYPNRLVEKWKAVSKVFGASSGVGRADVGWLLAADRSLLCNADEALVAQTIERLSVTTFECAECDALNPHWAE